MPLAHHPTPPLPLACREAAAGGDGQSKKQVAKMEAEVTGLQTQLAEMRLIVDSLEKERDFYFSKLREIEILCQVCLPVVPRCARKGLLFFWVFSFGVMLVVLPS